MLIRSVGKPHGVLDFLVPNIPFRRAKSSKVKPRPVVPPQNNTRSSSQPQSENASKPISLRSGDSDRVDVSKLRPSLVQPVSLRPETSWDSLSVHSGTQRLHSALRKRSLGAAWTIWKQLGNKQVLHLLGPSDLEMCSQLVADTCSSNTKKPWDDQTKELLEEMALSCAIGRFPEGLKGCLAAYIKRDDAQAVLSLYERFVKLLSEGVADHAIAEEEEEDAETRGDEEEGPLASTSTSVRPDRFPGGSEILLAAVAAHAMLNDFSGAIRTALKSPFRISSLSVPIFLPILKHNPSQQERATIFIQHAATARLVSNPISLRHQVTNLSQNSTQTALKRLYDNIISGFSPEHPWLTTDPSQVSDTRPVVIGESTWTHLIKTFVELDRLDLAETVWADMIRFGFRPTVAVWTVLLQGVGQLKGADHALGMWGTMIAAGIVPDSSTYQAIVFVLLKARRLPNAIEKFNEFMRRTPNPSADCTPLFNTMIKGYLSNSRDAEAQGLVAWMKEHGPKPDTATYNTFLAHHHSFRDYKSISATLQAIAADGLRGDVFTFSTLLSSLLRLVDRQEAIDRTTRIMRSHGIKPNVVTYSTIIANLLEERTESNLKAAVDVLRMMEEHGDPAVHPNVVTYTSLLSNIYRWPDLDRALLEEYTDYISKQMKERKIAFNRVAYHILIKACLANPQPGGLQQALQYYWQMRSAKVVMTPDTWQILLLGLMQRGNTAMANEMVNEMEKSGVKEGESLRKLASDVRQHAAWGSTSRLEGYYS